MSTYAEMLAKIEELQKQAEKQKREEYNSVLKSVKKQIVDYGFSAVELGLSASPTPGSKRGRKPGSKSTSSPTSGGAKVGRGRPKSAKRASTGAKVAPKYRDEQGNTWTGRGKQPRWVLKALSEGRSLDSLRIA